ncbi:ricin-type beta-trefoil lectin domain protein [Micromonospora sp. NPDC049107]|uniref:ricin-type beta-trefoil lectin domain protein n=1 Tax=Micromonospora sp. NPDC049107 TaxID=3154349 RepID=UPI0033CEBBBE
MTTDPRTIRPWFGRTPRRIVAVAAAALAVVCAAIAAIGWGVASARDQLIGGPVSDEQAAVIVAAARSCPMLSPARLAGQLMAESKLAWSATETASGGTGIAGLDNQDWKLWKPWPDAERSDGAANIVALAHQVCDYSGKLRLANVSGDSWRLSVAAFHSGLESVTTAGAVPPDAVDYVDQVSGYAAYYGKRTHLGGPGGVAPTGPEVDAKGVPNEYVDLLLRAGSVCPAVTPPAVAAQLMALSRFDPNLLGPAGQRGIAQFLPEVWQAYGPSDASAWEPAVAIPAVGTAMCAMAGELSPLEGDPYLLALAAYRSGPTAVRQSGGVLDGDTKAFLKSVKSLTDFYALDGRLVVGAKPAPSTPAPPSVTPAAPTPAGPGTPTPTAGDPPAPPTPSKQPVRPVGAKQLYHPMSKLCVSTGGTVGGTRLTLKTCDNDDPTQWWVVLADGTFRASGLCMDVQEGANKDGAAVMAATCNGSPTQVWRMNSKGGVLNLHILKALDANVNVPNKPLLVWTFVENREQQWAWR